MRKRAEPLGECSIESCTRTARYATTGWCQTHYHRWWRTGDPLGLKQERGASGPDSVNWKADDIGYYAAHTRVKKAKGLASQHDCVACGKSASEWAYDHNDPNENHWGTVAFSANPDHYQPMCKGCHVKLDRGEHGNGWQRKTHCANGHPYDDTNTYLTRRGHQSCRQCAKERAARNRKLLRDNGLTSRGTQPKR